VLFLLHTLRNSNIFSGIATQNPVEYLGTYPLPEAQLDRFTLKITIGYPSPSDESLILTRFKVDNPLASLTPVTDGQYIVSLQKTVKEIYVDNSLNRYIVDIVDATRKNPEVLLGASPRGSLSLFRASQAWAFYNSRDYVLPDDIKKMVIPVLSHRILLRQEAKLKKITPEEILRTILKNITVPAVIAK
jgi:MoxR-like ATPase